MGIEQEFLRHLQTAEAMKPIISLPGPVVEELSKGDPDSSTPVTIRNLFVHHDAHPLVINLALIKAFELDWLDWEPETLYAEIHREFQSQISEHSRNKIQAVKTCNVVESPWDQWQVFEKVVQALNNNIPRWDMMQVPSIDQLYVAVDIMDGIRALEFNSEVKIYMAGCFLHDNVLFAPEPLDFIQVELSRPFYVCKDCGSHYSALFHDGTCDYCTKKFDISHGLSMLPDTELLAQGKGKNMELKKTYEFEPVQTRWEEVKNRPSNEVTLVESQVDIQIAKLLVARNYLTFRRTQLANQLVGLRSWLESK